MADTKKSVEVATAFSDLKTLVNELEPDVEKHTIQGNDAAGKRVRKGMQNIKELAQGIRLQVQEDKNARAAQKGAK
jgi:hypothetical protein